MANKGGSGYIKRLNAPKYFAVHRKEHAYIIKQNPGRHTLNRSIALTVLLGKVGVASKRSESNKVIKGGLVSVNGKIEREPKFPVGLNDMIALGQDNYSIGINERGQVRISKDEKGRKDHIYKVIGKYKARNNQIMLRLHDGRAVKGGQDSSVYDSVVLSEGRIVKRLKLGPGSVCECIDGVHVGMAGTVKQIVQGNMHKDKSVIIDQGNGASFQTVVKNIIVVG